MMMIRKMMMTLMLCCGNSNVLLKIIFENRWKQNNDFKPHDSPRQGFLGFQERNRLSWSETLPWSYIVTGIVSIQILMIRLDNDIIVIIGCIPILIAIVGKLNHNCSVDLRPLRLIIICCHHWFRISNIIALLTWDPCCLPGEAQRNFALRPFLCKIAQIGANGDKTNASWGQFGKNWLETLIFSGK